MYLIFLHTMKDRREIHCIMKKILLIATGGTIASKRSEDGLTPMISSEELLSYVPKAREFCTIDAIQVLNIDSTNIQPEYWLTIVHAIKENYADYDGFVICHGTDTMAYTAAALSYLVQNSSKPIVLTGAQKPIDLDVTDARTNLYDSLLYACHPSAHGVCLVFDGSVIAGTRARKVRSKSYNAFESINYPTLATIHDGRVIQYINDGHYSAYPAFYETLCPSVFLLKLIPGISPDVLSMIAEKYDAIIIESYGVGGIPSDSKRDFLAEIDRLVAKGKIIVMTTQVMHEGSDMQVYAVGHVAKERYGLIEAFDMTTEATVTKLMWILGQTNSPQTIKSMFYTTINRDILFQG